MATQEAKHNLPGHCIHLFCRFEARASFVFSAIFLHYTRGLKLNFYMVLALLEYSVACVFCTGSKLSVIPIEHNT